MVPWKDENARILELQLKLENIKQWILQGPHDSLKELLRPMNSKSYSSDAQGLVKLLLDGYRQAVVQYQLKEKDFQQAIKDRNNFQIGLRDSRQEKRGLNERIDRMEERHAMKMLEWEERVRILERENIELRTKSENVKLETQMLKRGHEMEILRLQDRHNGELQELRSLHDYRIQQLEEAKANTKLIYDAEKEQLEKNAQAERDRIARKFREDKQCLEENHAAQTGRMRENIETLNGAILAREKFTPMANHQLKSGFRDLANDLDHLSRVQWKFNRTDWSNELLGMLDQNQRRIKQRILQDALWSILFEHIFCSPFRVFGEEGRALEEQWKDAFGKGGRDLQSDNGFFAWPKPSVEAERWRYETIKTCKVALDQPTSEYDSRTKLKRAFSASLAKMRDDLVGNLGRVADLNEDEMQWLENMPQNAAKMWLEMGSQRCRLVVVLPGSNLKSDIDRVRQAEESTLDLVTLAELQRFGNSKGQNLDKREIVSGCEGESVQVSCRQ